MAVATYYFNASDATTSDPNSVWTNDANAFDGSTATFASCVTTGSVSTNFLLGEGTNAPIFGGYIYQVRARIYGYKNDTGGNIGGGFFTNGLAEQLADFTEPLTTPSWTDYYVLTPPSGGWTWQKINDLEVKFHISHGVGTHFIARAEIEVTYGDTVSPFPSYHGS